METKTLPELLRAWREAEARWTQTPPEDADRLRAAALAVIRAWMAYQEASESHADALVLVADEAGTYVAVSSASEPLLGYRPADLVGRSIAAISASGASRTSADLWLAFLVSGRQDGTYELVHRDGRTVPFAYLARAHFPVAGFHTSVLTLIAG